MPYTPNLMDWTLVLNAVRAAEEQYEYETTSLALNHVFLETVLQVPGDQIGELLTDGPNDRGVDSIHIDDSEDLNVHFVQTKCSDDFSKAAAAFPAVEVDKLLSFMDDLLQRPQVLLASANLVLKEKVREILDLLAAGRIPALHVHLVSNRGPVSQDALSRLEQGLSRYRASVSQYHLEELARNLVESERARVDGQLRAIDNQYFERVDGRIRGMVATVAAEELVRLVSDPSEPGRVEKAYFDENVREYLGTRNRVNQRILDTALSDGNREFWYLNNGITITCRDFDFQSGVRAPVIHLRDFQIVNGGQTTHALHAAFQSDPERAKNCLVLVRIYATSDPEISLRVAESTNSQTPIRSRDLRSNEAVQRKLDQSFRALGYFYERKTNQYKERPKHLRIDAQAGAQAYLTYYLGDPLTATKERGLIFGEKFDEVFDEDITAEKILGALRVLQPIAKLKRELERAVRKNEAYDAKNLLLIDGMYHVLFAVSHLATLRGQSLDDSDAARALIQESMDIVDCAVQRERAEQGAAFGYRRFFKSNRAKAYILAEAAKVAQSAAHPEESQAGNAGEQE